MEFSVHTAKFKTPVRLQFYTNPPVEQIDLLELEELAVNRLRVLKCVESVGQDLARRSREYEERLIRDLNKLNYFGKTFTLPTNYGKTAVEDIRNDILSHFILQLAYCRSEDLRRWFIQQEVDLFRFRFQLEQSNQSSDGEVISSFLNENNLHFISLLNSERSKFRDQLQTGTAARGIDVDTTTFFKVYFTDVPELVRNRRVFLHHGYAFVPEQDMLALVVSKFRVSLSRNLARLGLSLGSRLAAEETRVLPLLASLSKRYLGEVDYANRAQLLQGAVKADQIDNLAKLPGMMPPCMAQLHDGLRSTRHLKHAGRMQYGLFLKGIGLSLDEALKFWQLSFAPRTDMDAFTKQYAYNVRHNYGKEGKRTDYTPFSCMKIISSSPPGPGEYHGCPFRHMDLELLRQRLSTGGKITSSAVDGIVQKAKEKQYQLSCREYFKAMHNLPVDAPININHPNQYFEESQKLMSGEGDLASMVGKETAAMGRANVKVTRVKVEKPSMRPGFENDADLETEMSQIDDSVIMDSYLA